MAIAVVDDLERVQIDEQHHHRQPLALGQGNRLGATALELGAIDQAGQRIMPCQMFQPLLVGLGFVDVGEYRDVIQHLAVRIADRADAHLLRIAAAIAAAALHLAHPVVRRRRCHPTSIAATAGHRAATRVIEAPALQCLQREAR